MDRFLGPFRRFSDLSGKSGAAEFWPFFGASVLLAWALAALDHALFGVNAFALSVAWGLIVFLPLMSLALRRLRDAGLSPYLILLLVFGLPGLAILLGLLALPGAGPGLPPPPPSAGRDTAEAVVKTLVAAGCYGVTLYWIWYLGSDSMYGEGPSWPAMAAFAAPFLYLTGRLFTRWAKPWPAGSGAVLTLYTLAILMIAVSYPYFRALVPKSVEGATKNKLAALNKEVLEKIAGREPQPDLRSAVKEVPELRLPRAGHLPSAEIRISTFTDISDSGLWLYDGSRVLIDCTHPDSRGVPWSSY